MNNNFGARFAKAILLGLLWGVVAALVLLVLSALLPGVEIAASLWGALVGFVVFLYVLLAGARL